MRLIGTYRQIQSKQWLALLFFWTFVAAFISTQLHFNGIKNGVDSNWFSVFRDQLPIWYFWALFTPFLLYLVNRYPLRMESFWRAVVAYVLFGLAFLLVTTNLTLIYMFIMHGYIDLGTTNYAEYSPYFFSRLANDALIYTFTLAVIITVHSYGLRKQQELDMALMQLKNDRLNNQLTQAQLQALKLQLNPHFLFNTLHTISSLTLIGDRKTSANVTTRLGDFLRRTLDYEEQQLVTLSKELEFFDLYLDIESIRFKDRLTIEKEIDSELLTTRVPNLILQPLVENAVKHGIARNKGPGTISLKIRRRGNLLEAKIYNDGPLLDDDITEGIGLRNIQQRLEKLYSSNFEFSLENDDSGNGVNSNLSIPIH
ncbi:MAG: histidine kinase [Roseivirga sp.]|nr:histidine kinase [Roseivirga sp.]